MKRHIIYLLQPTLLPVCCTNRGRVAARFTDRSPRSARRSDADRTKGGNKILKLLGTAALAFAILSITGCSKEVQIDTPGPSGQQELEATLTLRVAGGAPSKAPSRAMDADDENHIKEIDVLVFHKSSSTVADADAEFFYRAQTILIGEDEDDSSKKNFRITLKKSDDLQQLVVLANCRSTIEPLLAGFAGETYADVMAKLVIANNSAWNSADGTYDPLPMWGQNGFRVFTDAAAAADEIQLVRSLARIDVVVDAAAQDDFSLTGVYLYNPSTKGLLAPSIANWNASQGKVTDISLPSAGRDPHSGSFAYTTMTTAGTALQGVIYTFEASAATGNTTSGEPCLVVRGSWNGEADDSYYRIDFHDGTDFLPLKRNFHYNVSIDEVGGRGYGSLAEALTCGFTDMTATTHMWDDGNMGSIVWDGRNYLTVTTNEYTIYKEAQSITTITAATNYTGGWQASVALDPADQAGWLTITSASGAGDETPRAVNMIVLENNEHDRTAVVTVTAGRLKQTITITQKLTELLSLDVGDVEIVFSANALQPFSLPVEWEPAATPVAVELIHAETQAAAAYPQLSGYTTGLTFSSNPVSASIPDADGDYANGGFGMLSLKPDNAALATFAEHRSILKLTSADGENNEEVRTVLLRQFDYAITVTGTQTTYQLNTTYTFTVKANAQWEVLLSGTAGQITVPVTEYEPNTAGTAFSFTTGGTSGAEPILTFRLKEHPTVSEVVNVKLKLLEPNCYIVNPVSGSNTVTIPVRKVFEIWKSDADLNDVSRGGDPNAMSTASTYTAELLWQDEQSLITGVANPTDTDESATFEVTVNTDGKEGNAVVVLKENGTIRWSWHIWVIKDYDPAAAANYDKTSNQWIMDRNLGAVTNHPPVDDNDTKAFGLLYQHGRTVPFPGASKTSATSISKLIYDENNQVLNGNSESVSLDYNLANAIQTPLTFYKSVFNDNVYSDWYSQELYTAIPNRTDLWLSTAKTAYDPCPEGWKVPDKEIFAYVPFETETFLQSQGGSLYDLDGDYIGYFPVSARIVSYSGAFYGVGTTAYFWLARWRNCYHITTTTLTSLTSVSPASGLSVRCVKVE